MARLCSSAVESSAMIDPDRQIDWKSPASLIMLMTTLTSCFCRRPVSSVCSCFHTVDLARRNAARVLLVRSNTIRQDLMWRKDGSSRMTLLPGNITVQ